MMNERRSALQMLALAGAMAGTAMGCGHAAISRQLTDARATMLEARGGAAERLEPAELLIAQRTLTQAEAEEDGSPREMHLAYIAERETRTAMSDARRAQLDQGMTDDRDAYQRELERVARERGVALDVSERALAARDETVAAQRDTIAQHEVALTAEQEARRAADARAADAMARLRSLATVREEPTQTVITLSGEVLFQTGDSVLLAEARARLSPVADAMRASDETAVIMGFTDSRGTDQHNHDLSLRRAESVRTFLMDLGVPAAQMRAEGRGAESPIAPNDTVEGRAYNRRVEIVLHPAAHATATPTPVATR